MSGSVDWDLALRVAGRISSKEPFSKSYHYASLGPDFERFTAQAEELVAAETGLVSLAGPATGRVTDRMGWVEANINSFQRLLRPFTDRLDDKMDSPLGAATRKIAGAEVGALLGWMSTRVLGQYDLLVIEDEDPDDQDIVYYVGPNILGLEKRYGFPSDEFRLWIALHECTHRAQFTGVPWLREHFLSLVSKTLDAVDPDPNRMLESFKRIMTDVREGNATLDNGGLATLLASPEQRDLIEQISGMMSLLEGHGDITMDRAGGDLLPSSPRFSRVLRDRRSQSGGLTKLIQKLVGIEAKMAQYAQGERFVEMVEAAGGTDLLSAAWRAPEWLPTMEEIREPQEWIDRVRLSESLVTDI